MLNERPGGGVGLTPPSPTVVGLNKFNLEGLNISTKRLRFNPLMHGVIKISYILNKPAGVTF